MNYYKQGDAARAEEIRAAFEKLGYDTSCHLFNAESVLYFTFNCEIRATTDKLFKTFIKSHPDYKELELPVEPTFKVGDWIAGIDDEGDMATGKIVSFSHNKVLLVDTDGCHTEYPKTELNGFHLWTIEDARDGDVLATDNGWTCIFKAFDGYVFSSYCFMDSQNWFCESGSEVHTMDSRINGNIHPATKEQRDLLFAKMEEAGYEWDANKKELKKIQPHYDIKNFHAGMPVLVRETSLNAWQYALFSHCYIGSCGLTRFVASLVGFTQCIPFNDDTKHLLGTTDMQSEDYINW